MGITPGSTWAAQQLRRATHTPMRDHYYAIRQIERRFLHWDGNSTVSQFDDEEGTLTTDWLMAISPTAFLHSVQFARCFTTCLLRAREIVRSTNAAMSSALMCLTVPVFPRKLVFPPFGFRGVS
jgi:hypothetical protein